MNINNNGDEFYNLVNCPYLFIGLDRDGTLVPYTLTPDLSHVDAEILEILKILVSTKNTTVAIISARGLNKLKEDFPIDNIVLGGSCGLEIAHKGNDVFVHPLAKSFRLVLSQILPQFLQFCQPYNLAIIEDHGLTACLHTKLIKDQLVLKSIKDKINNLKTQYSNLKVNELATSYEFYPNLDWSKGMAYRQILNELQLDTAKILPVFIGDSIADESAYDVVNNLKGLSIKVIHRETASKAKFLVDNESEVKKFLDKLAKLRHAKHGQWLV